MRTACIAILLSLVGWTVAAAPQVALRADRTTVAVGEPFRVTIEASGTRIGTIRVPRVPGLVMESRRSQEQMQIINFEMTRSKSVSYAATATQAGTIVIPAVEVSIDGKTVSSSPLTITVEKGSRPVPQPRQTPRAQPPGNGPAQPPRVPKGSGHPAVAVMAVKAAVCAPHSKPISVS